MTVHETTLNQRAMLFLQRLLPDSTALTIPVVARVAGRLDRPVLRRALAVLVERHPALRTTFPDPHDETVAVVADAVEPALCWTDAPDELDERDAEDWIQAAMSRPFDVTTGPLFRVEVLAGDGGGWCVLCVHHLIADLWSMGILAEELAAGYAALAAGADPDLPAAAGFVAAAPATDERRDELREFWRAELDGVPAALALPPAGVRPAVPRLRGRSVRFTLEAALVEDLRALGRRCGATLYTVLLSGLQLVLGRYAGSDDVLVGTPVHGRGRDTARAVGLFVNTVVMRGRVRPGEPFEEWLRRNHSATRRALAHGDLPFADVVALAARPQDVPLVQVIFNLMRPVRGRADTVAGFGLGVAAPPLDLGPVRLVPVPVARTQTQTDLTLTMARVGDELHGQWVHDTDVLDGATVAALSGHLGNLLRAAVSAPATPVGALAMMSAGELADAVLTGDHAPAGDDLPRRVLARAAATPDAPAVAGADGALTYRELVRAARSVTALLAGHGVGPGSIVGVRLPRGTGLVVAALGVLFAGGAYLPLDPALPAERLAFVTADARPAVVLTDHAVSLPGPSAAVVLPPLPELAAGAPDGVGVTHPEQLAYVIYTSGTTGRPKAVMVPHRALANLADDAIGRFGLGPGRRLLAVTTFSFDIAALELLVPLAAGACVEVAGPKAVADGHWLRGRLAKGDVTHLQATPVTWRLLVDAGWTGQTPLVALCGGEALLPDLGQTLARTATEAWNLYGPTETTIWSTARRLTAGAPITIGAPMRNTRAYVLDRSLRLVPVGVLGELYLGGAGVTHGYLGRPGLTAQRFLPDPWGPPGVRMYRTGDLVRRRADGTLDYVGRADNQFKVNGLRVEPGEIEAQLTRIAGVGRAVVARCDTESGPVLVGYLEPAGGTRDLDAVRGELAKSLPAYLVPARLQWVESLPVSPNGKLDRAALPAPPPAAPAPRVAPEGPVEVVLHRCWSAVLGTEDFGARDGFFALGGHSLAALRIAGAITETFGVDVPLPRLLERPTVTEQAALVVETGRACAVDVVAAAELALMVADLGDDEVAALLTEPDQDR
ncbi:amino acid adenylation domain-containing protein [Amycolatopsis sp. A133]|uniref:non-ribosomal peptide synthetase n=1 Tax=Amycolatopsis sp. A133 TaxID=3064472 RepID=UPI0027F59353|nr:amino acid adenylation domain-containing protein [Amycolatopsis sp. A133]MDQ7803463.1 amino acid adenylation domain-containing protein [Amycolatopsis sp. A133]